MQNLIRIMNPGAGNVFYVNGSSGVDTQDGTTPETARLTITSGLSLCRNDEAAQDYVIVLRYPSTDPGEAVWPIAVDYAGVHIIGAGLFGASTNCYVAPPADTAAFSLSAHGIEIAGFDLAAGATHGCIENNGTVWRAHIHHNDFALQRTAQDGIRTGIGSVDCPHWLIEDNVFGEGIDNVSRAHIYCMHNMTRSIIRNNLFRVGTGVVGVHLQGLCTGYISILDNYFQVFDNAAGEAITTSATAIGLAAGNVAAEGKAALANNPYVDGGTFSWGNNMGSLGVAQMPA